MRQSEERIKVMKAAKEHAQAVEDRKNFRSMYGHDNCCSCHINPPCFFCTHTGNPANQEGMDIDG